MYSNLVVPVVVVEVDGVERRVDLLEGLAVPQLLLEMLPCVGPQVPIRAGQDADSGGLSTEEISNDISFILHDSIKSSSLIHDITQKGGGEKGSDFKKVPKFGDKCV